MKKTEKKRQASETQREKGRQRSRARDKKQRRHFFVGRTWKFCSGGDKMRNASVHQCKEKMSGSEREYVRYFLHKKVSGSFRCSRAKQRQRKVQKKCAPRAKLLLLIRPFLVFSTFSGVAFAAFHHTILYFVWANYKYYRELPFQPWLNLCIIYNNKHTSLSIANLIVSRHTMRGKRPHFRLTCVAQKRFCLKSSL